MKDAENNPSSCPSISDQLLVHMNALHGVNILSKNTDEIVANRSHASQEVDNTPHDHRPQDLLPNLAGMLNSHCRRSPQSSTTSTLRMDPSTENRGSSSRSVTPALLTDQIQRIHPFNVAPTQLPGTNEEHISNSYEDGTYAGVHEDRDQHLETRPSYTTEFPNSLAVQKTFMRAPDESLAMATSANSLYLDPSPHRSRLITSDDRGLSLDIPTRRSPSPTTLGSPQISHFESNKGLLTLFAESFKSTGGGHTDEELSRSVFHGGPKSPKTDTPWQLSDLSSDYPSSSMITAAHSPDVGGISQKHVPSSTRLDQQASSGDLPFICLNETPEESHEAAGSDFASDQVKLAPSSPIAPTEYSQSHPYFASATNARPPNSDFRTDVVGTNVLSYSSPPPSPSMNSNYYPSSSPLPDSSPTEGSSQTPPTSPTQLSDAYNQSTYTAGSQETFYKDENYSTFSHYAMQAPFYPASQQQQIEHSYPDAPHEPHLSTPGPMASPYPTGYYPSTQIAPGVQENTIEENVALVSPTSDPPYVAVEASPRVMTIPAAEELPSHADYLEAISIPAAAETRQHVERPEGSEHQPPQMQQTNPVPRPKRPTLAAHRLQHKKLSKPFRSPVVQAPIRLAPKPDPSAPFISSANPMIPPEPSTSLTTGPQPTIVVASSSSQPPDSKLRHRSTRAASQFKSPLSASSTSLEDAELVRLTPTIQSLERKLQLLRRALKVREDGQEEVLEGLAKKWSDAGKDAAWDVWDLVKDNVAGEGSMQSKGKKRAIEESWGWDESGDSKKPKVEERERNWGWDIVPVSEHGDEAPQEVEDDHAAEEEQEDKHEEAPRHSLGTMLMELGIAPETLGWNEEEGTFADN